MPKRFNSFVGYAPIWEPAWEQDKCFALVPPVAGGWGKQKNIFFEAIRAFSHNYHFEVDQGYLLVVFGGRTQVSTQCKEMGATFLYSESNRRRDCID